jgi:hypothetical protein
MKRISKRTGFAAAAAVLAVGGGGAAIAATQFDSPSARSDAIVSDAAKQLGIDPAKLSAALKKAEEDQIEADVAAGRLTKEQGDALKSAIEAGNVPLVGGHLGFGLRGLGRGAIAVGLDTAASYLGLTREQLRSELQSGKTLAQVATEHGKTADGLVSALVDAAKKRIDAAVSAGKLPADVAQNIESKLQPMITALVQGTLPRGPGFGLKGFAGPGFGFRGFVVPGGPGFRLPDLGPRA